MIENELDVVKTSDLTLASTLLCLGNDVVGIDKIEPRSIQFYFRRTTDLEAIIKTYFEHKSQVEPQAFMSSLRDLRSRMHTDL